MQGDDNNEDVGEEEDKVVEDEDVEDDEEEDDGNHPEVKGERGLFVLVPTEVSLIVGAQLLIIIRKVKTLCSLQYEPSSFS